jgi:predicted phosphodiesterase
MRSAFVTTALLAASSAAREYKIGVLSDIHLNDVYSASLPASQYCSPQIKEGKVNETADVLAYFGRPGCDSSFDLIDRAMAKLAADNPDFVLVPGDLIGHAIAAKLDEGLTDAQLTERYTRLRNIYKTLADLFKKHFADSVVLGAFGNNDSQYHYQPAFGSGKGTFYDYVYKLWFTDHPANSRLTNLVDIKTTMQEGGWYRASLVPDKLTLLSFNSLQYGDRNKQGEDGAELDWLEA